MKGWLIILVVFLLLVPGPAWGQEEEPVVLEEIQVTAGREEESTFEVSTGVTVVGPKEVERRAPEVLPDLLRGEEGVYVQQTTPGQGSPIIRGLVGSSVLHLVDGMRLNNAFFRNAPNQYLALVDAYNVKRVEVVRGPASTLYGSDAMGGVVQVITPIPRFEGVEWQLDGRVLGQFASADLSGLARLSLEAGKEGIGFSGGFTYRDVNDRRVGGGDVVPFSDYTAYAGNAKVLFAPAENQEVLFNFQFLEQPKTPRTDELVPGFGQTQPSSAVFFFEPNNRLFLQGRYRILQPLSFVDVVEVNAAYQEINDDRRQRNFGSPDEIREENSSELKGVTLQASSHWGEWMNFTYGGEAYFDKINSSRIKTDIQTGATEVDQPRFPDGSTMNSFGFYILDEIRIVPSLVVTVGGRFSHFDTDLPATNGGPSTSQSFNDVTGSIGLTYALTPEVKLVTNVGRGFRAPNVFDLGTFGARPGNRFNRPNPDLDPEKIVTVDWGVKVQTSRFQGEAFGYYSDFTDKIESVPTGDPPIDGRIVVKNRNLNRVILWGAEVGARFQVREDLELSGNLTYTWAEEEFPNGSEFPADRIPPLNGRVALLYWARPTLWVEPFVRFAARQDRLSPRDIADPRIDPNGTPGWATINVKLGWDAHPNLGVRFALENITDANYREHGSGIDAPGINAILSVEGRF
ncbi:MAG: TonB-dependent receptor [candidate division NC10 bacterium]|nr:TonB-dependent receptor [candidate division NC10 bacterium]